MRDYKDIRLSDEDFLQGIYVKADVYGKVSSNDQVEEFDNHPTPKRKKRTAFRPVATGVCLAASCALAVLGVFKNQNMNNSGTSTPENVMYRSVDEPMMQDTNEDSVNLKETQSIQVVGTIDSFQTYDGVMLLMVSLDEKDNNELPSKLSVVISEYLYQQLREYEKMHGIEQLAGEHVLLYIESYNWQEYYKVSQDDGIYLRTYNEDGEVIYENMDGEILTESDVIKQP